MGAEITPTTGLDPMAKLGKSKVGLMLAIFILFALLPALAAAAAISTASTADQSAYPCNLLPWDSQALYNLSSTLSDPAQLIGAASQAHGPFNYATIATIGEEAHQLAIYNWWRYCEQKSAPAWMSDNPGTYQFEYPDGGGAGQQPWASWRPELISAASLRSVRRERESPRRSG